MDGYSIYPIPNASPFSRAAGPDHSSCNIFCYCRFLFLDFTKICYSPLTKNSIFISCLIVEFEQFFFTILSYRLRLFPFLVSSVHFRETNLTFSHHNEFENSCINLNTYLILPMIKNLVVTVFYVCSVSTGYLRVYIEHHFIS